MHEEMKAHQVGGRGHMPQPRGIMRLRVVPTRARRTPAQRHTRGQVGVGRRASSSCSSADQQARRLFSKAEVVFVSAQQRARFFGGYECAGQRVCRQSRQSKRGRSFRPCSALIEPQRQNIEDRRLLDILLTKSHNDTGSVFSHTRFSPIMALMTAGDWEGASATTANCG